MEVLEGCIEGNLQVGGHPDALLLQLFSSMYFSDLCNELVTHQNK